MKRMLVVVCGLLTMLGGFVRQAKGAEFPDRFVEYIQGTGGQYIDLGQALTDKSHVSIDFYLDEKAGAFNIFGIKQAYAYITWDWMYVKGMRIVKGCDVKKRYVIDIDVPKQTIAMNGEQQTLVSWSGLEATSSSLPVLIFWAGGSSEAKARMKLYACTISEDGEPKRQLFPCVKGGKAGLYDAVSKTIFYDAGGSATDFAVGPDVPIPDACASLIITGEPAEYGLPEPAYGAFSGPLASGSFTATAPASWESEDGQLFAECTGWRLSREDGTEISGAGCKATFADASSVQNGTLTWLWKLHAPFGVSSVTVGEASFNRTELNVALAGIGLEAETATITVRYGSAPTCLYETAELTVDRPGVVKVPLDRLLGGIAYYAQVSVRSDSDDTYEGDVVSFVQPAILEPGLHPRARAMPAGCVQMEKLTSTGTEWILTDVVPTGAMVAECEFGEVSYVSGTAFFGQGWAGNQYLFNMQGSTQFYFHGGGSLSPTMTVEGDTDYSLTIEPTTGNNGTLTLVNRRTGNTIAPTVSLAASNAKLGVFATNGGGNKSKYSLYSLAFRKADALVADFVPAYEQSSARAGLYDFTSGVFYPSKGTPFARQKYIASATLEERADGFVVTVPASDKDRTVSLYAGAAYGGTNGWGAAVQTATVRAGETTASFSKVADWGVTVRFARACVTGDAEIWSKTVIADDASAPSVVVDSVDGTGGDTLVVRGTLQSFPGDECALTVLVGSSQDSLTGVWQDLPGSVKSQAGTFELTLFESDPAAVRYLRGDSKLVVVVEATAGGRTVRTGSKSVAMKGLPTFGTVSSSVNRRKVDFTGSLTDCGACGKSVVTLWAGEGTDPAAFEQLGEAQEVVDGSSFKFTAEFPQFERDYGWQFRATATTAGGTTNLTARSDVKVVHTLDSTGYTWKGGGSGDWCDAASWSANTGNDRLPWPQSSSASVSFPGGQKIRVRLTQPITVGTFTANLANLDLTFFSEETDPTVARLTLSTVNYDYAVPGIVTLSNAAVKVTASHLTIGSGRRFVVDAGSDFYVQYDVYSQKTGTFEVRGGSTASVSNLGIGGGGVDLGGAVIDDATLEVRTWTYLGYGSAGGSIRFEGDRPLLRHTHTGGGINPNLANACAHLDFLVPVGGYASAPVVAPSNGSFLLGSSGSSTFAVNVHADSPAARVDGTTETVLIDWPKGIIRDSKLQEGTLPTEGDGSAFAWTGDNAGYPTALAATIVGSAHGDRLDVASSAAVEYCPTDLAPAYGAKTGLSVGEKVTCAAPKGLQPVSDDVRVTCMGWKLYLVDPASRERTLERSGTGTTCEYVHDGRWHQLEWQWADEFRVTATAGAGGTVSMPSPWVTNGSIAVVTASADAGKGLARWTGDVPDGCRFGNPLTFVLTEPVAVEAVFGTVIHVETPENGGDDKGKGTAALPYATVAKGLSVAAANDLVVVGAGTYLQTAGLTLPNGVLLRGASGNPEDVVLKATGNSALNLLTVNDANAGVFNLTLDGDNTYTSGNGYRTPLYFNANGGRADNCILRHGFAGYGALAASGVYLGSANAVVTRCVISDSRITQGNGYVVYGGGKVSNCLIAGNRTDRSNSPIISLTAGGLLENCTVVGNLAYVFDAHHLKAVSSALVANCVFADNIVCGQPKLNVSADIQIVVNCACDDDAFGEGCLVATAAELFKDPAHGDWAPRAGSPLVNAGGSPTYELDTDLACHLRVADGAVDIGAYELDLSTFDFSLSADRSVGPVPGDYAFTASVGGCEPGDVLVYSWDFEGDGVADVTTTEPQCTRHYETHGVKSVTLTVSNDTKKVSKTLTFENQLQLLPKQLLVVNGNPGAAFPYDTWATAAADIQTAIDAAVDGCEVVVSNGVYAVKQNSPTVTIAKGVTVRGLTGCPEDVRIDATDYNIYTVVSLDHAEAVLSGVAVGATVSPMNGRRCTPVYLDACGGQVTNCVIRNGYVQTGGFDAAAVYMASAGALVTHCVISNCCQLSSNGYGAIWGLGRLSNCLVVDNRTETSGAVVMLMDSGSMENCTFVRNEARGDTYYHFNLNSANTRVANCVLARNTSVGTSALHVKGSGTYVNCVSDVDVLTPDGDNAVAASDEIFADAKHADWSPKPKGPLVDAGRSELVELTDSDLAGSHRIVGAGIDIGAYELDTEKFSVSFAAGRTEAPAPAKIGLSVALTGCDDGDDIRFCWDFDGDGTTDEVWTKPEGSHDFDSAGWADVFLTVSNLTKNVSATCGSAKFLYLAPSVLRVRAGNSGAAFPYDTWENAAADIQTAIDAAVDGCEVVVSNGVYAVKQKSPTVTIAKGVTVRGLTGRPEDVRIDATDYNFYTVVSLDHAEAVLSGVTVGVSVSPMNGKRCTPVYFDACGGQVTNCVIRNGYVQTSGFDAAAVYMASAGALVTHCVISNCCQLNSNGYGAIWGHGRLSNCLVVDNRTETSGAIVMLMGSGSMENCTFVRNEARGDAYYHFNLNSANTRVANCVLARNTSVGTSALHVKGSGTYVNCVSDVDVLTPDGNNAVAASEEIFTDAEHSDWSPKPKGPLVDAGSADAVRPPSVDLAGAARISGKAIDIGAYELDAESFSVTLSADRTKAVSPVEILLSVSLTGCDDGDDVRFCWDFDGDGTTDEVGTDSSCRHVFDSAGWADVFLTVSNLTKNVSATCGSAKFLYLAPSVLRVRAGNSGAAFPYDTWENAAADIQTAIDAAVEGCEVVVSNGVYAVKQNSPTVTIAKGVTVRGLTGCPEDVRIDSTDYNFYTVVSLDHAEAVLSGVTVGVSVSPANGRRCTPVYLGVGGGQVTNCVIRNGYVQTAGFDAAAVYMASAGALVTHCVISNCCQLNSNGYGAIWGLGRLSNCLLVDNRTETSGAIVMLTDSGSMENCTFVRNEARGDAYYHFNLNSANTRVANCVLARNTSVGTTALHVKGSGTYVNCVSDVDVQNPGVLAVDEVIFADAVHGDWTPMPKGPLVDAGSESAVLASDTDLAGTRRIIGNDIDVGAFELDTEKFSASFIASWTKTTSPAEITFTVSLTGCDDGDDIRFCWDFDGDGTTDETLTTPVCSHAFTDVGPVDVFLTVENLTKSVSATCGSAGFLYLVPPVLRVSAGNLGAAFPYDTWENAAADIQTAIDAAVDGCEVVVSNGVYAVKQKSPTVTIAKGVTVRGLTGRPEDVRIDSTDYNFYTVVSLDHAEAVLSGVSVGVSVSQANGKRCTPVYLGAGGGQVTNCVIRNGYVQTGGFDAAAVYMASAGALVTHCVISNCCQLNSNGYGAIWGLGRLSNCLLVGNRAQSGAALIMLMESGSLENCTVVENEVTGSVLHLKLASTCGVRNSIFVSNLKDGASGFTFTDIPACFSYCLCDITWLGGKAQGRKASAAEVFNDPKRPWHLRPGSPAVDVVPASDMGVLPSVDLGGRTRMCNRKLDLGCYECQVRGLAIIVR